jgi:hypothetical protein
MAVTVSERSARIKKSEKRTILWTFGIWLGLIGWFSVSRGYAPGLMWWGVSFFTAATVAGKINENRRRDLARDRQAGLVE